jgi:hypothetical protein
MTPMPRGTARDRAESWAARINQSFHHIAMVTSAQDELGTTWFLHVRRKSIFFQDAFAIGWLQRRPGHQGPQVRFLGGKADGYGAKTGKIIDIKTIADLEA